MKQTLLATLVAALLVLPAVGQRQTAEASFTEGKVKISYGSPSWRDDFGPAMDKQKVWRLGNNDPTSIELSCGLMTNDGAIPAGAYKMAMRKNDQGKWDLVVYSGNGQYQAGQKGWGIKSALDIKSEDIAKSLKIAVADKKLEVRFGPNAVVYPFTPVKMHKAVETEFARIPAKVEVMAVPVDGAVKNMFVGTSSVVRGGQSISWNMHLTIDDGKASLSFKNARSIKAIEAEAKQAQGTIERIKEFMANADEDRKPRLVAAIKQREEMLTKLEAEKTAMARFRGEHSIDGEAGKGETPASTLGFESKRIEGGLILKFAAGKDTASFDVNPREFFAPRR